MSEQQRHPDQEPAWPVPRLWIGSLADYNAGRLHGEWVDAAVDTETLNAAVKDILNASPEPGAEEFGIFDYEGFGTYRPGEYDPLDQVASVARGIAEHGLAFAAWAELHDGDPDMLEDFEDSYLGEFESGEDWARQLLDGHGLDDALDRAVPEPLRSYVSIDYAAFARDADLGSEIHIERAPSGRVWIFRAT